MVSTFRTQVRNDRLSTPDWMHSQIPAHDSRCKARDYLFLVKLVGQNSFRDGDTISKAVASDSDCRVGTLKSQARPDRSNSKRWRSR